MFLDFQGPHIPPFTRQGSQVQTLHRPPTKKSPHVLDLIGLSGFVFSGAASRSRLNFERGMKKVWK